MIKFPAHKRDYAKIERENNVAINVFSNEDEMSYHIYSPKQSFEKHVNLLLLSNYKNSHYVLIEDFDRFMTNKTKHNDKKYFCQYCFQCFSSSGVLECYIKNFDAINHTKSILLPAKNQWVNFKNFKGLAKDHS